MSQIDDPNDATRATLLSRLKDWENQESWKEFFEIYWRLIYRTAMAAGLSDADAQDVVQETIIRVAKKMPSFRYEQGKDSFKGWLLFQTRGSITPRLRKRRVERERFSALPENATIEEFPDASSPALEVLWDREWEETLLEAALERVKSEVSPKQYLIYSFYVLKDLPALQVAKTLEVNLAQVYLAKHRVAKTLRREIRKLKQKWI